MFHMWTVPTMDLPSYFLTTKPTFWAETPMQTRFNSKSYFLAFFFTMKNSSLHSLHQNSCCQWKLHFPFTNPKPLFWVLPLVGTFPFRGVVLPQRWKIGASPFPGFVVPPWNKGWNLNQRKLSIGKEKWQFWMIPRSGKLPLLGSVFR